MIFNNQDIIYNIIQILMSKKQNNETLFKKKCNQKTFKLYRPLKGRYTKCLGVRP